MDILARLKSLRWRPHRAAFRSKAQRRQRGCARNLDQWATPEERSWITFEEGRALFSAMDDQYAFGELDEPGKLNLGAFAADRRVELDFRPVEGRIYFTRRAS